ncbi:unnamed protein product [Lactuca virosa]|uniref:Uncharacterized protein n=1 Tax=Lactuca virosa TaxID=75947 RepID=A0AAU9P682_9ASTR|nr:unnamed protein product [Lactuca virosa]
MVVEVLAIMIDVGTNNDNLLENPLYFEEFLENIEDVKTKEHSYKSMLVHRFSLEILDQQSISSWKVWSRFCLNVAVKIKVDDGGYVDGGFLVTKGKGSEERRIGSTSTDLVVHRSSGVAGAILATSSPLLFLVPVTVDERGKEAERKRQQGVFGLLGVS